MKKPSVREKLLQAGLDQFHRAGFNGSSVEDITDLAGVPKGSFYNHFDSKQDLAAEVVDRYCELGPSALLRDTAASPVKRLKRYFTALIERESGYKKGCLLGNFSSELADHSEPVRRRLETAFDAWVKLIASVIKVKAEQLAGVLLSTFEGALLRARAADDPKALREFLGVGFSRLIG
jgi:TetR/AcrR family transcriptional repressor of nem operon